MAASTLALGQASYQLLELLDGGTTGKVSKEASVQQTGSAATLQASRRGGEISNVSINQEQASKVKTINITDRSSNLSYSDVGDINSVINLLASSKSSEFNLGNGSNRFNAANDLVNSEVTSFEGSDTIRIGGNASGSFVSTGDGNDQFTANRASTGLDVVMGEGDDTALFLGTLTAGANSVTPVPINEGLNIVDTGEGNDRATFLGGARGGVPGDTGYELQLGTGNDTAVFGPNSSNDGFVLNTGTGSDNVTLGRNTSNAVLDLGWDNGGAGYEGNPDLDSVQGDLVILGVGATLAESGIRSGQSQDTLRFAGTVVDTSLDLGWGGSLVEVDGRAGFGTSDTTVWDLGGGNDTLIFGELSDLSLLGDGAGFISLGTGADELILLGSGYGFNTIEFDLGNDGDIDIIRFGLDSAYAGFTISNFGRDDILFIGSGSYGYGYQFLNELANEIDLQAFRDGGNVIWSQNDDGSGTGQTLMTLDDENFTAMGGLDGDLYSETVTPEGDTIAYRDSSTIESLSDQATWSSIAEAPMSETPPSAILPDDYRPTA